MTNPYGGYGMPQFQMPNFQGGSPQALGQGMQQWAQGLRSQFQPPQGGGQPNFQGMAQGLQNRLLQMRPQGMAQGGAPQGGGWQGFRGSGPGQGGGAY